MLRKSILWAVRKKNPVFMLDTAVTNQVLLGLLWSRAISWLRGLRLLFHTQSSPLIFLGRGVRFFNRAKIRLGSWVQLEDQVYLSGLGQQGISIGNNVRIGAFSQLVTSTSFNDIGSHIRIGDHVGIGEFAYLGGGGGLDIGPECIIGQYFSCHPENHNFQDAGIAIRHQGVSRKGIRIGRNCWIGSKVTILDGVRIGDNCVIAAGAVVTKSMPPNSVIGGVPATVLKTRNHHNTLIAI